MKKSYFWLIVILILLTTYTPKSNFLFNSNFYIKKIEIENNVIIKAEKIKKNLPDKTTVL